MFKLLKTALSSLMAPGKLKSLDGLRAIAILLVLVTHISQRIPGLSLVFWNTEWATPLYNGWIGVDLFFVLSGFLIGSIIVTNINNNSFSVFSFYRHRFFRILPAYFFVLLFVILLKKIHPQITFLANETWKDIIFSFGLLTDYAPTSFPIGSWSLSIEEHFYLFLPAFFIFFRKTDTRITACLILIFLALIFRMVTYRIYSIGDMFPIEPLKALIYYPFHNRMDALAIGVLISLLHNRSLSLDNDKSIRKVISWLGILLVGFIYLSGGLQGGFFNTTIQYTLVCFGFGGLLWGMLGNPTQQNILQSFLSKPFWIPLARISYSLYLTNVLTLNFITAFCAIKLWMFLLVFLTCLLVALPLYLFIEFPFHHFGKKRDINDELIHEGVLATSN